MHLSRKGILGIAAIAASAMCANALILGAAPSLASIAVEPDGFGLEMNSSKNKFHSYTGNVAYDGEATFYTELGNAVDFQYYQVKGNASTWHVLGAGGYFYNTDPIHSLKSISLTFKTDAKAFSILYSHDAAFGESQSFTSSTSSSIVFDFNDYLPNYFKVVNESGANLNVSSVSLEFSCENLYPNVTLSSEDETMGTVSGGGAFAAGTSVTIAATPAAGCQFVGWFDGENLISSQASYTFTVGNADLHYTARFALRSYNLYIWSESTGKGTVSNSNGSYLYGESVTILASANEGYSFTGWHTRESYTQYGLTKYKYTLVSSENPYTFSMPSAKVIYYACFEANKYTLSLTNEDPELGSISGGGSFAYGSSVTLTATPKTGVAFLGWYNGSELVSPNASHTFPMPYHDLALSARFEWATYTVSVVANDDSMGSVYGSGVFLYGQGVTVSATPADHHTFLGWFQNEEKVYDEPIYAFSMPDSSLVLEARFSKNYHIELLSDDDEKLPLFGPTECGAGLEVTVYAQPQDGYAVDNWYDDDFNELCYENTYTFTMPEHDLTLYASVATAYALSLTSSDLTKGTVSGGGYYKAGTQVSVTMEYISGTFKGWYDSNNQLLSSSSEYTFSMPANDYALEAKFRTQAEEEEVERQKAMGQIPVLSENGKTLTYGLYPQTRVTSAATLAALNALGDSAIGESGWYLYEGSYYAKVSATPHSSGSYKFEDGTSIYNGRIYWFHCDRITWDVLSVSSSEYLLLSHMLLDAHSYRSGDPVSEMENRYEISQIRSWLNEDFLNSAFALDSDNILVTKVDNSAATTDYERNNYAGKNTNDKIFLLSYQDYLNVDYGFSASPENPDGSGKSRSGYATDYVRARGGYVSPLNKGDYWTRSPEHTYNGSACVVHDGGAMGKRYIDDAGICVRPALRISLD